MIRIDPAKVNGSQTKLFLRGDKVADASPSGRTITNTGTVASAADASFPYGKALDFNGSTQYLSCADHADFKPSATTPWTLDFYVERDSNAANQHIFSKGYAAAGDFRVYFDSTATPLMKIGLNANYVTELAAISTGVCTHYAIVSDGTNCKLYKNGVYQAQVAAAAITNTSTLYIGYNASSATYLDGRISGLRWTPGLARWTKNFIPPTRY